MQDTPSSTHSEDCLNLDVHTPPLTSGTSWPVFVWLFGGGFLEGAAAEFSAESLRHLVTSHGLVVVVPDFRLGAFGYLGSRRLWRNSTGNWATLDQLLALSWVREHVGRFGGDASRVTVGGWSSGAASLSVLLGVPSVKGLLSGALMMSGGFTRWASVPMGAAEKTYEDILRQTGCHASSACWSKGPPCACLLDLPAARLAQVGGSFEWAPVVDGRLVQMAPYAAVEAGEVHAVPIVIGSVLEDAFPVLAPNATDTDFRHWLARAVPAERLKEAYDLYLGPGRRPVIDAIHAGFSQAHWAAQRATADRGQACVARRVSRRWAAKAWQYFWETRYRGEDTSGFGTGLAHSTDQHFLFERKLPAEWAAPARALHRAVSSLAHSGDPGKGWPAGGGTGAVFLKAGPSVLPIRPEFCDFWDTIDRGSA